MDTYLGHFRILAVVDNAAKNTGVCKSFKVSIFVLFGYVYLEV